MARPRLEHLLGSGAVTGILTGTAVSSALHVLLVLLMVTSERDIEPDVWFVPLLGGILAAIAGAFVYLSLATSDSERDRIVGERMLRVAFASACVIAGLTLLMITVLSIAPPWSF